MSGANPQHRDPGVTGTLSDSERAAIRKAVLALPPLSDAQIEALSEVIRVSRTRRHQPPTN
ncbi:MAG: hypothetical protein L0Y54_09865, partial [Sporichthyaceae bacterium]|nr:hypothetical protein [Sporichthyaceae bacterium]